jgi:hypothetical protein
MEKYLINILNENNNKKTESTELTFSGIDIETLKNSIEQLGFSEKLSKYSFEYKNLFHKGIILYLLSYFINNNLSPFKSLDDYIRLKIDIDDTRRELEEALIEILDETKETFK